MPTLTVADGTTPSLQGQHVDAQLIEMRRLDHRVTRDQRRVGVGHTSSGRGGAHRGQGRPQVQEMNALDRGARHANELAANGDTGIAPRVKVAD